MPKYKEMYDHATSIIVELQRENRRLNELIEILNNNLKWYHDQEMKK